MARAADTIRGARARAGLSQRALAARVGVSQPVIAAYESGRNQPTVAQLDRIVRAAGFGLHLGLRPIGPDPAAAGEALVALLELADRLPQRHRRTLAYPLLADARR
jgi:transcriptional regulator with XRE-family HTH domain